MPECPLTEMPIEMCGCPKHRPDLVEKPKTIVFGGSEVLAKWNGKCSHCFEDVVAGEDYISRLDWSDGTTGFWVHSRCYTELEKG